MHQVFILLYIPFRVVQMDCNVLNLIACLDSSASCKVIFTMGNKKIIVCEETIPTTTASPTSTPAATEAPTTAYPTLNLTEAPTTTQNSTPSPSPYLRHYTPSPNSEYIEKLNVLTSAQTQKNGTFNTTKNSINTPVLVAGSPVLIAACITGVILIIGIIIYMKKSKPPEPPEPEIPPAPDARHKTRNSWIVPVKQQERMMKIKELTSEDEPTSILNNMKPRGTGLLKKQMKKLQVVNSINKKKEENK